MREVKVGKKYKHFKGSIVEVILIAKDSETLKDMVVYKHDGNYWVRDKEMFLSKVDRSKYSDVLQEYRFEEIGE